jgi:CAAX amino terminal protease family.
MNEFLSYVLLVFPGLCLAAIALFLLPFKQTALRLAIVILAFILLRDALVPSGLWKITQSLEMRFIPNEFLLLFVAVSSLIFALSIPKLLNIHPEFSKGELWRTAIIGVAGSFLVVLPVFLLRSTGLIMESLEKPTGTFLLTAVLVMSLCGNFLEEVVFRGGLQTYLKQSGMSTLRSGVLSAVIFSLCHSYLAFTVTSVGALVLVFTLWEGLICAFLAARYGLLASTMAHGLGIFFIASSII